MPRGHNLYFRIYNAVRKIPAGRVASYGQIATLAGSPRSARIVGWALRTLGPDSKVPWHRVVNKAGVISIQNMDVPAEAQAAKLRAEGIDVIQVDSEFHIDLKKFGWDGKV